jgi:hypothetical protein
MKREFCLKKYTFSPKFKSFEFLFEFIYVCIKKTVLLIKKSHDFAKYKKINKI